MSASLESIQKQYATMRYAQRQNCPEILKEDNLGTCSALAAAGAIELQGVGVEPIVMVDWYRTSFHASVGQIVEDDDGFPAFNQLHYYSAPRIDTIPVSDELRDKVLRKKVLHPAKCSGRAVVDDHTIDTPTDIQSSAHFLTSNTLIGAIPDPADFLLRLASYRYSQRDRRTWRTVLEFAAKYDYRDVNDRAPETSSV